MKEITFRPSQMLVGSFLVAILVGAGLLRLPAATVDKPLSMTDALFTATSAVCVTGLTVVDVSSRLSAFGQIIVMLLFQLGGIGIMTFTSMIIVLAKGRISLREEIIIRDTFVPWEMGSPARLLKRIVKFTLAFEAAGFLLLCCVWVPEQGVVKGAYWALFHAISAFCNAGFSLFPDSFVGYRGHMLLNIVVITLIVFGGLGFFVNIELYSRLAGKHEEKKRLSLHSRLVLLTTVFLVVGGSLLFFGLEYHHTGQEATLYEKAVSAVFQAVTARTAGFNTVDMSRLALPTVVLLMALMFIGASPGSTGGGTKTTTWAVMFAFLLSQLRGKEEVVVHRRAISWEIVNKALLVFFLSILTVTGATFLIALFERAFGLQEILFEVLSAFGTVGLSLGITPRLSVWAKLVVTLTMFIGRVGIFCLVGSFVLQERGQLSYPEEKVVVG